MAIAPRPLSPDLTILLPADRLSRLPIPFFVALVPAGFPSPAEDYVEGKLDLNDLLVQRPAATFFVRIVGDSMTGAGIFTGDLAIVDRSLKPERHDAVVAVLNGELTVKLIMWDGPPWSPSGMRLEAANPDYEAIPIAEGDEFIVWGVVTATIHRRRGD